MTFKSPEMKKYLLVTCLFLFSIGLSAQTQPVSEIGSSSHISHSTNDAIISFSPNVLYNTPDGLFIGGGMKLRLFVSDRFSFDSDCVIGPNYMHFGPGIIGLPLWYLSSTLNFNTEDHQSVETFLFLGAIMILSAEHFSFHIPMKHNTDISPYMSFLRFKTITEISHTKEPDKTNSTTNFAVGLEIN